VQAQAQVALHRSEHIQGQLDLAHPNGDER
jgi:hypothetical protein